MKKIIAGLVITGFTALLASEGATIYKRCAACHGADGKTPSMGKSQPIAGWSVEKQLEAMKGYKDGTYGGAMKGIMKGQVTPLTDEQMQAVAEHISKM